MQSIYQEIILDHYHSPHNFGELDSADLKAEVSNSSCGDKIYMQAKVENDRIVEVKFKGIGCAISLASASMLTDYVKGKTIDELKKLDSSTILDLLGIELSPNRLKCALLPLEGVHKLINRDK